MRIVILSLSLVLFWGCGFKQEQKSKNKIKETSQLQSEVKERKIEINLLDGIWGESIDENASFWIKNDSMYFLEDQDNPASIYVIADTLITDYDGFKTKDKICLLTKDSLILLNEVGDTLKMVRIK